MKIRELTEAPLVKPKITQRAAQFNWKDLEKEQQDTYDSGNRETGAFAKGETVGDQDQEYKLTTFLASKKEDDAKYQYLKAIRGLIGVNPYVPTVYEIDLPTSNDDQIKPEYITEKLLGYDEVVVNSIVTASLQMAEKVTTELETRHQNIVDRLKGQLERYTGYTEYTGQELTPMTAISARNLILYIISSICEGKYQTKDKQLNQVCKIIQAVNSRHKFFLDVVGPKNVLFRRVPWGIQPVINDPLAPL